MLFGAGAQIYQHARLFIKLHSQSLRSCSIINRSADRAHQLLAELKQEFVNVPKEEFSWNSIVLDDRERVKQATGEADLVVTATSSKAPLFEEEWLSKDRRVHINLASDFYVQQRSIKGVLKFGSPPSCIDRVIHT